MKKITIMLSLLVLLTGCNNQQQANNQNNRIIPSDSTDDIQNQKVPTNQKKIYFKNNSGYAQGDDITVFLYNKDKTKKFKLSFKGDVSKVRMPEEEDIFGNKKDYQYWSFGYDML